MPTWDFNYCDICLAKCITKWGSNTEIKLRGEESGDDIHDSERRAISQARGKSISALHLTNREAIILDVELVSILGHEFN